MKLYYKQLACSFGPHIVLRELGADFTLDKVDFKAGKTESGHDFATVNPKGYIPVLELDDGQRLTEAGVILQYLADRKPELGLLPPQGSMERYRALEWLNYIATELHKSYTPIFTKGY